MPVETPEPAAEKSSNECVLRFEDVSLSFDQVKALEGLSFEMQAGETRIVLGAAGSGKTTLLKAALGLIKPDSGRIFLFGQDITNMSEQDLFPIRARVGVLFQEGGLFDSLTVEDNVSYPLENRTAKPNSSDARPVAERVLEALRFVELETTLSKLPDELSGGMRRRVGIARAVVTEPPLVLYDSPTAGLDPITANTIMTLVAKERDTQNTANVIVTHRYQDGQLMANFRYNPHCGQLELLSRDPSQHPSSEARTVFMVMNEGKLVFEGDQSALESSGDDYVKKFVRR
jgi:phospholipid/cholesterol/gamma-HCH transport system ATP-binding protein